LKNEPHIILIGNYLPDKQESMVRFAHMLDSGFRAAGISTEIWWPRVFFGKKVKSTYFGVGKWLAYLDKWVLFPLLLRWRLLSSKLHGPLVRFHVCDHSNAPYLKYLPVARTGITCHDVLAIRGAMGYADAYAPASFLGKILQKWILYYLSRAKLLAAVSQLTINQLRELTAEQKVRQAEWVVIHNALNADFSPTGGSKKDPLGSTTPYLLHVGSGLPRKNRQLLLSMVHVLGERWQGNICFAGEAIDEALLTQAESLGLSSRMISVVKPEHEMLVALYRSCEAFVFPSFSEGFGWPVIEAQACGVPVIASNIDPMPEISGGGRYMPTPPNRRTLLMLSCL
jgi:glycosyltransferase involved in cell wall biosynthesis